MQLARIEKTAYWLVLIGGINWLFAGLLGRDFVSLIFSPIPLLTRLIYLAVGVSAVYLIYAGLKAKTLL